jgi:MoaA/NifB/PqqE/SkfB family radical SAM enzyme
MFQIYLTKKCNLRCETCLRECYGSSKDLDLKDIKLIFSQIKEIGYNSIAFTGGEPCLHSEFDEVIDYTVMQGFRFSFATNGILKEPYEKIIDKYKENINFISCSVDGATEEIHRSIRNRGSLRKTLNSLKIYHKKEVITKARTCINKNNLHQIEKIASMIVNIEIKYLKFGFIIHTELNKSSFFINPYGEATFCCDTIKDGVVIGNIHNESIASLMKKKIKIADRLKKIRAYIINKDDIPKDFNSCEFCNYFLKKRIR